MVRSAPRLGSPGRGAAARFSSVLGPHHRVVEEHGVVGRVVVRDGVGASRHSVSRPVQVVGDTGVLLDGDAEPLARVVHLGLLRVDARRRRRHEGRLREVHQERAGGVLLEAHDVGLGEHVHGGGEEVAVGIDRHDVGVGALLLRQLGSCCCPILGCRGDGDPPEHVGRDREREGDEDAQADDSDQLLHPLARSEEERPQYRQEHGEPASGEEPALQVVAVEEREEGGDNRDNRDQRHLVLESRLLRRCVRFGRFRRAVFGCHWGLPGELEFETCDTDGNTCRRRTYG